MSEGVTDKDDVKSKVKKFFHDKNRPFSLNDVIAHLHTEVGCKSSIPKAVDSLVEENTVVEKVFGKQKVYVINQNLFPEVDQSALKDLDLKINEKKIQLQQIKDKIKTNLKLLSTLNSRPSLEEITKEYSEICQEEAEKKKELDRIKQEAEQVKPEVREVILQDHEKISKEVRKRKRYTNELLSMILDGYPLTKKQLIEEIGLDMD